MREYARIRDTHPTERDRQPSREKPRKAEADYDIVNDDLNEEFAVM